MGPVNVNDLGPGFLLAAPDLLDPNFHRTVVLLGMAEYKTSPLRKGKERGHLFVLLYMGVLLIVTRALNMVLYSG